MTFYYGPEDICNALSCNIFQACLSSNIPIADQRHALMLNINIIMGISDSLVVSNIFLISKLYSILWSKLLKIYLDCKLQILREESMYDLSVSIFSNCLIKAPNEMLYQNFVYMGNPLDALQCPSSQIKLKQISVNLW